MTELKKCSQLAFQGDIALLKINALPDGVTQITHPVKSEDREAYGYHAEKGLVLAQGESRQHFHAFRDTENVKMYASNDNLRLYVVVENKPCTLFHEEHNPIEFDPSVYELIFQQEWNDEEEYRRVAD